MPCGAPRRSSSPRFPTTQWEPIGEAAREDPEGSRPALGDLLTRYRAPIMAHLRRCGLLEQDAEDVLHDFVAARVLEQGLIAVADRRLGRFRTFLLTVLDRYVIDRHRSQTARSRRPPEPLRRLDERRDPPASSVGSPDSFEIAWARSVIAEALTRMREHCKNTGRTELWQIFEARILRPILKQEPPEDYLRLVERLCLKSYSHATKIATESKHLMQQYLRQIVAEYESDEDAVESELQDLFRILGERGGAGRTFRIN